MSEVKSNRLNIYAWVFVVLILVIIVLFQVEKKNYRITHPLFTTGVVTGKSSVAKGDQYLDYSYSVNNISYKGSVPIKFCLECSDSCCTIGAKVKVRYAKGDPSNSDLIH